jgi:hypothetical protein
VLFLGLVPLWPLYYAFANVAFDDAIVTDFRNTLYPAAEAIARGDSPYPQPTDEIVSLGRAYVYPPLVAILTIPFTWIPVAVAEVVVLALLVVCVLLTLRVLDVRDWRCYGIVFLWQPVIAALKTGNVTILLGLGAALVWRYRDKASRAGITLGVALAAKLFLWPLLIWLAATRRWAALGYSIVVGSTVLLASWAAIGFAGIGDYPDLLRRLGDVEEAQSYTVYALALDLGSGSSAARILSVGLAAGLLGACVLQARRGAARRSFVLALAAVLAASPIVWLHYYALLVVAVAIAQPRLAPAWFVPIVMLASASTLNGSTFQTALTVGAAGLTIVLSLLPTPVPRRSGVTRLFTPATESR